MRVTTRREKSDILEKQVPLPMTTLELQQEFRLCFLPQNLIRGYQLTSAARGKETHAAEI